MRRFLSSVVVMGAVVGCTSVKSADVKTSGMSANMQVVADGTGTTQVAMQLHVDNNITDLVDLTSGDTLTASTGSASSPMSKNEFLGDIWYTASFPNASAEGTVFTVAFNRASDVSAPSSVATLPKPFDITSPAASSSQTFSRAAQDITVSYDSSGTQDSMSWQANGSCIQLQTGSIQGDPGTFTIAKGTLVPADSTMKATSCQVTVAVIRSRAGTIDSHFGYGGSAAGQQQRSFQFQSTM